MRKILIIEDDHVIADIYRNRFSVEGFQVEHAVDGPEGLEKLRRFQPDAVILDLVLPKMNGVEVMKRIRSDPDFQKLPVIVFSNTYLTKMVQEAWKAGATKCLSKASSTPSQLVEVVRGTLGLNGATAVSSPPRTDAPVNGSAAPAQVSRALVQAASTNPNAGSQAGLRKSFIDSLPALLARLRSLLQGLSKADSEATRHTQFHELHQQVSALAKSAVEADLGRIAQLAGTLEALLKELHKKPKLFNPSTLRTLASAVDLLGLFFERGPLLGNPAPEPHSILFVDDEPISARAMTHALSKAKLRSVNVKDPTAAYDLLAENRFDLIFLDVDLPGMSGFNLCTKLRQLPAHKHTPVVFVTVLDDLKSRANSMVSGGNDFIAKPFLFLEVAVKALVHVLRGRLPSAQR
jgi:CheY-like chemotaxis protein